MDSGNSKGTDGSCQNSDVPLCRFTYGLIF
jgi:hypothetical protein